MSIRIKNVKRLSRQCLFRFTAAVNRLGKLVSRCTDAILTASGIIVNRVRAGTAKIQRRAGRSRWSRIGSTLTQCTAAILLLSMVASISAAEPSGKQAAAAKKPPKEISVDLGKGIKLEMVLIPAGEFMMGSPDSETLNVPDEKPQHRVRISKTFYLGKYPVTQEQWEAVMGNNPSEFKGPTNPVESVSWDDCQQFLKRLNAKVGGGKFQLPTEAQWEYACRAGSKTRYCFGDDAKKLGEYAWYHQNAAQRTHPVGRKKPNAWGLYDMHGNVAEFCTDWYDASYYAKSPSDDPPGPKSSATQVIRGGTPLSVASWCRSAMRGELNDVRGHYLGLRVSRAESDK